MAREAYFLTSNLITAAATITVSSENALYLKANLYDGRPSIPFKFNAAAADDMITIDFTAPKLIDFCSIHDHNIDAGISAIELRSSSDNFSGDDDLEATMVKASPTFYARLSSPVNKQYWRVKFVDTNGAPIRIGELVMGAITQFSIAHRYPLDWNYRYPQIRNRSRAGEIYVYSLTSQPSRVLRLSYRSGSAAVFEQLRDDLYVETLGGATPLVIVPDIAREEVLLAHLNNSWDVQKIFNEVWQNQLIFTELPMGVTVT